ncbi:MAG: pilus assembly protein [Enterovirga sp.]|nr:pilus assembly protein [Enterovirga sp.]
MLRKFIQDKRGGILMMLGFLLPVLVLAVAAVVEYGSIAYRHSQLQKAADAASLTATQQLRLSNTSDTVVNSVARETVDNAAPPRDGTTRTVTATVLESRSAVQVSIVESVRSMMGKVLTLPTSEIGVVSKAKIMGNAKLCLLALEPSKGKALNLDKDSLITANGCVVHSNSTDKKGLTAGAGAVATAASICSSGGVENKGANLSPFPVTDCPVLADPLASKPRPASGLCLGSEKPKEITTYTTLYPGTYCKGLTISGTGHAVLASGIYVINDGPLIVKDTASITGQNVGLFFTGNAGGLRFDPDTTVSLTAPKDGPMAGLLFFEDRSVTASLPPPPGPKGDPPPPPYGSGPMRQYRITSDNAPNLLGTIYLPAGRLIIDAKRPVSDKSSYTVVVVKQLELNSGPNLYLNTDYGATDIPVPEGVGPKSGNIMLTR